MNHMMRSFLIAGALLLCALAARAASDVTTMTLYAGTPPQSLGTEPKDIPTLTAYIPKGAKRVTPAILVCPGGGYAHLAMEHEGSAIATWLNSKGIAAFVLKYRLPADGYKHPVPLMDASHALSTIRAQAEKWNVDPKRIGVMGFSAGGHLASTLETHYHLDQPEAKDPIDRVSCRPDFAVLGYPVVTMKVATHGGSKRNLLGENPDPKLIENLSNETQVNKDTPPTFLMHASDDKVVPVANSLGFYTALVQAGVPAEMHIYEVGGHGWGIKPGNKTVAGRTWMNRLAEWLQARGIVEKKSK